MLAAGVPRREIERTRRENDRLRPGCYVPPGLEPWDRYRALCLAVLANLAPSAALTGPSAAALLEVPLPGGPPPWVTVRGVPRGRYGDYVRVLNGPAAATLVDGVRLVEPAVVVADCARLINARDALIVADALLHEGRCAPVELQRVGEQSRGTRGAARVRWIAQHADALAESPGETWTRLVLAGLGYAATSQVVVSDGDFRARVDFMLADGRTVLEFDGAVKYRGPEAAVVETVMSEKERQAFLESLGHVVLRIIWRQLVDPAMIDRRLRFAGAVPDLARRASVIPPRRR